MPNINRQITLTSKGTNSGPLYNVFYSLDCINYTLCIDGSNVFLPNVGSTAIITVPDNIECLKLVNQTIGCGSNSEIQIINPTTTTTTSTTTTTCAPCCTGSITSITDAGGGNINIAFQTGSCGGCIATTIQTSSDNITWGGNNTGGCTSPRTIPAPISSTYYRIITICSNGCESAPSNGVLYVPGGTTTTTSTTTTTTSTTTTTQACYSCNNGNVRFETSATSQGSYPTRDVCSTSAQCGTFVYDAIDRPNRFNLYDSTGLIGTSGWVGYANYAGPWGASLNVTPNGSFNYQFNSTSGRYVLVEYGNADPFNPTSDAADWSLTCGTCPTTTTTTTTTAAPTTTTTTLPAGIYEFTGCGRGNSVAAACNDAPNSRTFYSDCNSSTFGVGCFVYVDTFPNPLTGYSYIFMNGANWDINSSTGQVTAYSSEQC